ncbi:MAG: serine hydrolase family protein [Candidatus Moranbacteria bacterium]|nr:serine hydrolase family protein [Candidatus Moranbacteria bacterium]
MRKEKIILVHGWGSSPRDDWFPWVSSELKKLGFDFAMPEMPNTEEPKIEEWVPYLEKIAKDYDENTIFVGHSIGCQAIMRFLEKQNRRARGAVFVAGWFELENLEEEEGSEAIAKPWIETPIDFEKVKRNIGKSIVFLGDNDPWVPVERTKESFEINLGSVVEIIPGAGHMSADDGFSAFPRIIEEIAKLAE